MYISEWSWW